MNFLEAVKAMKEGKKVKSNYMSEAYLYIEDGRIKHCTGPYTNDAILHSLNDWLISEDRVWGVDDDKDWCLKDKLYDGWNSHGKQYSAVGSHTSKEDVKKMLDLILDDLKAGATEQFPMWEQKDIKKIIAKRSGLYD